MTDWMKLANKNWLVGRRYRFKLSLSTIIFALLVGALTSAFAGLFTPVLTTWYKDIETYDLDLRNSSLQTWVILRHQAMGIPAMLLTLHI
jgi:hypothetical protein